MTRRVSAQEAISTAIAATGAGAIQQEQPRGLQTLAGIRFKS